MARYPIPSPTTRISGNEFRIDYNLPQLLVGEDQAISLRGTLDADGWIATQQSHASFEPRVVRKIGYTRGATAGPWPQAPHATARGR
jgi:hypothetical protein